MCSRCSSRSRDVVPLDCRKAARRPLKACADVRQPRRISYSAGCFFRANPRFHRSFERKNGFDEIRGTTRMRLSSFALTLALLLPVGVVQAQSQTQIPAGSSHFAIFQNDKNVGSSEFTVTPTAAGYTITSRGDLRLTKLTYSF